MADTRHVHLMLSSDQLPDPVEEIRWHADHCARTGKTAVVTTQLLSGMTRGKSIVAFYGNAVLGNRYLGQGIFAGFAKVDEPRGKELLSQIPLYADGHHPKGTQGMVELTDFRLAAPHEELESLNGKLFETYKPLTLENLPESQARSRVYFMRRAG